MITDKYEDTMPIVSFAKQRALDMQKLVKYMRDAHGPVSSTELKEFNSNLSSSDVFTLLNNLESYGIVSSEVKECEMRYVSYSVSDWSNVLKITDNNDGTITVDRPFFKPVKVIPFNITKTNTFKGNVFIIIDGRKLVTVKRKFYTWVE